MDKKKEIEKKVFAYIEEQNMLCERDKVVVGVSGGADSVCLFFVLLEYAKIKQLALFVVHVHHGIRAEADWDAQYVEQLCLQYQIPYVIKRTDVRKEAKKWKCSEEEAGRKVRYQAFWDAAKSFGATKIAVAHSANDRAETLLFHLFRGSDLKGLGSIRPMRDGIIRPLLLLERREIEEYVTAAHIPYCQDATNEADCYTRNRIRHHILPYVEEQIVQNCVAHMAHTAQVLDEIEVYLAMQTEEAFARCVTYDGEQVLLCDVKIFQTLPDLLKKRVIYRAIQLLTQSGRDITHIHVEKVLRLFEENGNRSISLPKQIIAERSYDQVSFRLLPQQKSPVAEQPAYEITYQKGTCEELFGCSAKAYVARIRNAIQEEVLENQYTKCFDYDKIKQSLPVLRTRQPGDYITLSDTNGVIIHKSIKKYMIDEKIPRQIRGELPVLAVDKHVLWILGYRMSELVKITGDTKCVLQVQITKKTPQKDSRDSMVLLARIHKK